MEKLLPGVELQEIESELSSENAAHTEKNQAMALVRRPKFYHKSIASCPKTPLVKKAK